MKKKKETQAEEPQTTALALIQNPQEAPIAPPPLRQVFIADNNIMEVRHNRFFQGYAPVAGLPGIEVIKPKGAGLQADIRRISYEDWCQWVSFHRWSVKEYNAETLLDHFIAADGEHITTPFHQQVTRGSMTIAVDYTTEENLSLLAALQRAYGINPGDFQGTTHNHVKAGAFASGVDHTDETSKQGWHFTIGNCDKAEISIDGRVRMKFSPTFDEEGNLLTRVHSVLFPVVDWTSLIDVPGIHPDMPATLKADAVKFWLTRCPDNGFPDEWKEFITEKKWTPVAYSGSGYQGYRGPGAVGYQGMAANGAPTFEADEWQKRWGKNRAASGGVTDAAGTTTIARAATVDAVGTRHQVICGSLSEDMMDKQVLAEPSISRDQYREYKLEIRLLDLLAAANLTRMEAIEVLNHLIRNDILSMYGQSDVIGRTITTIVDDGDGSSDKVMAAVCTNIKNMLVRCSNYVVSVPPSESWTNRKCLLETFMAVVE